MPVVHAVPSSRAGGVALQGAVGLGLGSEVFSHHNGSLGGHSGGGLT